MWQKIWSIAWKDIIETYTDRNLVLIMLVTPLALATIIALAFSGITEGGGLRDIPVALVNLDEGTENFNGGEIFVRALVPGENGEANDFTESAAECAPLIVSDDADTANEMNPGNNISLYDLTNTTLLDDPDEARAGVDTGLYAAAIIIPPDFSRQVAYSQDNDNVNLSPIEVYGDRGRWISASVIRSVTASITNQMVTGQIAVASTIETMIERAQTDSAFGIRFLAANAAGEFQPDFACAFQPGAGGIHVTTQTAEGEMPTVNLFVMIGSAQAAFFALFTAAGGASSVLEERQNWTLQRLLMSPTPRFGVMLGKMIGVFAMVLLQLVFLFVGFNVVNMLISGEVAFIWGTNIPAIVGLIIATALSVAGVGMVIGALARTVEQANIIGGIIGLVMGVLGGAFFTIDGMPEAIEPVTRLSVVRWSSEGFMKLAQGDGDIMLNLIFLLIIGAVMFVFSLFVFNRRQDI